MIDLVLVKTICIHFWRAPHATACGGLFVSVLMFTIFHSAP